VPAKILIIDDDKDARALLNTILRAGGHETVYATDAYTAIPTARREQPDLILLDFGLPAETP
jgi:two-component system response regulator MtrA